MVSRAACQLEWLQWNRYEGPTPLGLNRVLRVPPNLSFDMHSLRRPFIFSKGARFARARFAGGRFTPI